MNAWEHEIMQYEFVIDISLWYQEVHLRVKMIKSRLNKRRWTREDAIVDTMLKLKLC